MSFIAWMDYSESDRKNALDVIDLFSQPEARDELGIGTIRDAIAEALFPGTSTIQTRAKYFLFIPWIYLSLEKYQRSSKEALRVARDLEVRLITALLEDDDTSGNGVIGREARADLKRLASSVYWQGLGRWGIRKFDGSQEVYHRYLDEYYRLLRRRVSKTDDGEVVSTATPSNWHLGLPEAPSDFPSKASLELSRTEAEYLRERIATNCPGSLLSHLVQRHGHFGETDFAWELTFLNELPQNLQDLLRHARNFSEVMHGASLLYNRMIAELSHAEDLFELYDEGLKQWWTTLSVRRSELVSWDRDAFWLLVRAYGNIPGRTQLFAEQWMQSVLQAVGHRMPMGDVLENDDVQQRIKDREYLLKRQRARLSNAKARQSWTGNSGSAQLNFRWTVSQRLVVDILDGLKGGLSHA